MRLIDADALMETIKTHDYPLRDYFNSTDRGMFTFGIQYAVDEQPTVDAVPVIHAKWVQNPYSDEPPTCSHCGFESSYYYDRSKSVIENRNGVLLSEAKSKYCPNCGARMKKGEEK